MGGEQIKGAPGLGDGWAGLPLTRQRKTQEDIGRAVLRIIPQDGLQERRRPVAALIKKALCLALYVPWPVGSSATSAGHGACAYEHAHQPDDDASPGPLRITPLCTHHPSPPPSLCWMPMVQPGHTAPAS